MNKTELTEILELHERWVRAEQGGQRADLEGANLYFANLEGFDTLKHYSDKLRGMIRRKRKEATRASNALLGRKVN